MWYYLRTNYGRSTVSNLLYLTRITRNFEKSVEFVLNTPLRQIYEEWADYYESRYTLEEGKFNEKPGIEIKLKKKASADHLFGAFRQRKMALYAVNNS